MVGVSLTSVGVAHAFVVVVMKLKVARRRGIRNPPFRIKHQRKGPLRQPLKATSDLTPSAKRGTRRCLVGAPDRSKLDQIAVRMLAAMASTASDVLARLYRSSVNEVEA